MSAYEKHKLSEAVEGQVPELDVNGQAGPPEPTGPGSTPHEVAEDARRQNEARDDGRGRIDRLITVGRADQTTGRE